MPKVTFELPDSMFLRNVNGEAISLDWTKVSPKVLPRIMSIGAKTILTNVFNGGGAKLSDSAKLGQMQKKIDAWERGDFEVAGNGRNSVGQMKAAYIDLVTEATGASSDAVEKAIRDKIKSAHGKDAPAKFATYFDIHCAEVAKQSKRDVEQVEAEFEAKLLAHYGKMQQKTEKQIANLDLSDIDI